MVVPFFVSCGTCRRCTAGRPLNCETTPPMASYGNPLGGAWGGLFDDLVRVPFAAHAVVPVPPEVSSPLAAAVGDNLTDAYVAVGPALRERPDSSVLVLGGTPSLSLLIVVFALAVGRGPVTFADPDPERCAMARRLGAHVLEGAFGDRVEGEYDLVVDAHGDPRRGPAVAVRSAAPGGRCHLRSVYFGDVPFPYFDWTQKGLTVEVGLPQIQTHAPAVLELLASGTTRADQVIHPARPWEAAAEVVHDRAPGKPVFVRG